MSIPDEREVHAQVAAFEAELAKAASARDAQTVRDRFLGRKNSVVASWMQMIGGAPPDQKREIGRRQRTEAGHRDPLGGVPRGRSFQTPGRWRGCHVAGTHRRSASPPLTVVAIASKPSSPAWIRHRRGTGS
jgi:hypothetical protein